MIRFIYGLLYTLFVLFLTVQMVNIFCVQRKNRLFKKWVVVLEWITLLTLVSYTVDRVALRLPIIIMIGIINILLLYETKVIKALLLELFTSIISIFADFFVYSISEIIFPGQDINNVFDSSISYYLGVVSLLLQLLALLLIEKFFKDASDENITADYWSKYLLFPLFSLLSMSIILYSIDSSVSEKMEIALLLLSLGFAGMNIFVFYFLRNDIKHNLEKQRFTMIYHNADELQKMYKRISDERIRLGKENHEYKNTISVWSRLLKNKEYTKLDDMITKVSETESFYANVFNTGNDTINIILNDKFYEAASQKINFVVDINDLSCIEIPDEELVILLSNVLNNAIEACQNIDNAIVFLKIAIRYNHLVLTVKNTFNGKIQPDLKTTKQDSLRHGYGLLNVKSLVERHNGNCSISYDKNMFTIRIILPLEG